MIVFYRQEKIIYKLNIWITSPDNCMIKCIFFNFLPKYNLFLLCLPSYKSTFEISKRVIIYSLQHCHFLFIC